MRITKKHINHLVTKLNILLGQDAEPYSTDKDGNLVANVGTFYVGGAYGGFQLERIVSTGGAVSVPYEYRGTQRETYLYLKGIIYGMEIKKEHEDKDWLEYNQLNNGLDSAYPSRGFKKWLNRRLK